MKSSTTFFYVMVLHVFCLGLVIGCHAYHAHVAHEAAKPVMRLKTVIRTLTEFRASRKTFPGGFAETDLVSRMKFLAEADDRTVTRDNVRYVLRKSDADRIVCWAFPVGPFRDEAPALVAAVSDRGFRWWKGPALSDDKVRAVVAQTPSPALLAELGMVEQKAVIHDQSKAVPSTPTNRRQPAR